VDEERVRRALCETLAPFGVEADAGGPAELPYGRLYAELTGGAAGDPYPAAIESVYEGYLLHYRESRLLPPDASLETRLLAGDHCDACGLRIVASGGDLDSVELLTRLMATCSWLRAEGLSFAYDDDLWALTVAGLASVRTGGNAVAGLRAFDEVALAIVRGRVERLPEVVRRAAAALYLKDPRPLRAALGLEPAAEPVPEAVAKEAS